MSPATSRVVETAAKANAALIKSAYDVVDDVLAKGDRVVVLCTESAQRGGRN